MTSARTWLLAIPCDEPRVNATISSKTKGEKYREAIDRKSDPGERDRCLVRRRDGKRAGEALRVVIDDLQGRPDDAQEGGQQPGERSAKCELSRRERVSAIVVGQSAGRHQELRVPDGGSG